LDSEGQVLSNVHLPASYGFMDSPGLVLALEPFKPRARLVHERAVHGDFLAVEAPAWLAGGHRFVVIGGVRADSAFVADLAARANVPPRIEVQDSASVATPAPDTSAAGPARPPLQRPP